MEDIKKGFVSTIIPVYNRTSFLKEAVGSVIAQTYRPIELIIVDDGSTDETPGIIKALTDKYPEEIRHIRLESNKGPGPAREAGRQLACGEFIQYLDSDDILLPGKFASQVKALEGSPECGIAYGYTKLVDKNGNGEDIPCKWTGKTLRELFPGLLVDRWWCTHTPLYRRSLCDRIGPWSNLMWSQDWEYDARAGALNTRLVHCREFVSMHRHHMGERQTAEADWNSPVRLKNRADFLQALYMNACKSGITPEYREMRHFSRWAFFTSRGCGSAGLIKEAAECLGIAKKAWGGKRGHSPDILSYEIAAKLLGWKLAGKLSIFLASALKGNNPGVMTLKQSWMEE